MSDQETDYRGPVWIPLAPDVAVGYAPGPLLHRELFAVLVYGPSVEKLRGIRMRVIGDLHAGLMAGAIHSETPPGPQAVADAWSRAQASVARIEEATQPMRALAERMGPGLEAMRQVGAEIAEAVGPAAEAMQQLRAEIAEATRPEELVKRPGEPVDAFYSRVARAHRALSGATSKPNAEIARITGKPVGTVGSWISRARARGLYPTEEEA